ncbi:hypothetical protein DP49_5689 [Burkholderia pseudomallei]|nr:hypothetical protein DP49_5689 [Burkholderia pseudomallei]
MMTMLRFDVALLVATSQGMRLLPVKVNVPVDAPRLASDEKYTRP